MVIKLNNNSNNNPFYGMRACLNLLNNVDKAGMSTSLLDAAYAECDTKEKKEMFFSLLFSIGDITNRHHNIFGKKKVDNGGNANRTAFDIVLSWMWNNHREQFIKFLNAGLFNQYQCFDSLFKSRIKTHKGKVISSTSVFTDKEYCTELLSYVVKIINGKDTFDKHLVAKFLTPPRLSKRQGHKQMLPQTKLIMEAKGKFLIRLSKLMGWEYEVKGNILNLKGYRQWRKKYNKSLESVLFSTHKINEFDETQFIEWFDKLPAQARFRVKNRVLYSKDSHDKFKWDKFKNAIVHWENYKAEKQKEQRLLEEKVRQGNATIEDRVRLAQVKKEAKVTTGAITFRDLYKQICNNNVDELKLESFIQNKVNMPYNNLVIVDASGSMSGAPFNFAAFIAAVCLVKNPDDDARSMLGMFSNETKWYTHINKVAEETPNFFWRRKVAKSISPKPFVNPKLSFIDNYRNIRDFMDAVFDGGWTNISSLFDSIKAKLLVEHDTSIIDGFKQYPVWTIISDGEWNNMPSPEASVNDLLTKCERYLGFKPFIVAIDIAPENYLKGGIERLSGIENLIYIPANPAQIEQFLCNFKDMEVFDIYTPLQSLHRSNRYSLVRENII